jgi:hypothetical protein
MPRKMTKTKREALARAKAQKAERRKFQAQLADQDFKWGQPESRSTHSVCAIKQRKGDPQKLTLDINLEGVQTGRFSGAIQHDVNLPKGMSEEEYAAREAAAQEEIEHKKTCIAPAYNKGAYQYIGSREMAEDAGKKK